jgi:hypothetical protein
MPSQIYKITTFIKSNTNPSKWFEDTLSECLEDNEDILETKVESIGNLLEDESEGRSNVTL